MVEPAGDSRTQNKDEQEVKATNRLRRHLQLYFYSAIKWKSNNKLSFHILYCIVMFIQVIKVGFITRQMFLFGDTRENFSTMVYRGHTTLRHLLLYGWDSGRETLPYPPANGEFASYHIDDLTKSINYAITNYYNARDDAIGYYKRMQDDHMSVRMEYYDLEEFAGSAGEGFTLLTKEFPIRVQNATDPKTNGTMYTYDIEDGFAENNLTDPIKRLLRFVLKFNIHSVRIHTSTIEASCLSIYGEVSFSDLEHNGQMKLDLETTTTRIKCRENGFRIQDVQLHTGRKWAAYTVLLVTSMSILLMLATMSFGFWVRMQKKAYMKKYYKPQDQNELDLPALQCMCFLKFWDGLILLSDVCTLVGTAWLLSRMDSENWTVQIVDEITVCMGVGCTLAWAAMLRYFNFYHKTNVLFATVYKSLGNVVAYLCCVVVLFIGFLISGFVVLGPYNVKFKTPMITADTLFSLINGDEIFATLHMLDGTKAGGQSVWFFSRLYIYAYVGSFTIVVLNILIAIFNSAYEIAIKTKSAPDDESRELLPIETSLNKILAAEDNDGSNALRTALLDLIQDKDGRVLTCDEDTLKKELSKIRRKDKPREPLAFMGDETYTICNSHLVITFNTCLYSGTCICKKYRSG